MKLSLSVRIVEAACKTRLKMPFEDLVDIARKTGYSAICMCASAGGVETPLQQLEEMRRYVESNGLFVSMVTADFDVPLNNAAGPNSLREIGPSLDVAEAMGCNLVRVCLKEPADIPHARDAVRAAARRGIRLAHQCHTSSLFEEVDPMLDVLRQIDHPNFGLIYEPANLLLCGQPYGTETMCKLSPHVMNAYVQNHRLDPAGQESLPTNCRGDVRFEHLDPWASGGVDFTEVIEGLHQIDYDGTLTIHQAQGLDTQQAAQAFAQACADFFISRAPGGRN